MNIEIKTPVSGMGHGTQVLIAGEVFQHCHLAELVIDSNELAQLTISYIKTDESGRMLLERDEDGKPFAVARATKTFIGQMSITVENARLLDS